MTSRTIMMIATSLALTAAQGCGAGAGRGSKAAQAAGLKASPATQDCRAGDIELRFDGRDGEYTGMSHDGARMVLRNTSAHACTVPKRPQLAFTDAAGKPVDIHVDVPPGMHPGPVLVPVLLAPGASAQGKLQWVMGPVYDKNTCADTAHAALALPGGTVKADLHMHLCGQTGSPLEFEEEWLQLSTAANKDQ